MASVPNEDSLPSHKFVKKGKKTPYLSSLPREVLSDILRHLSAKDLSNISETCRALNSAAITEQQYYHRLSQLHAVKGIQSCSIAYRRFRALRTKKFTHTIYGDTTNQRTIIGSAGDSLVMYDKTSGHLIGFPNAWSIQIGSDMAPYCIMVAKALVIIVHCENNRVKSLQRINVHTGQQIGMTNLSEDTVISPCLTFSRWRMQRPQVGMSAGRAGDHVMFVSEEGEITVLRLEDGKVVRREELEGDVFSGLVRGLDGGWWCGDGDRNGRVIAILRRKSDKILISDVLSGENVVDIKTDGDEVVVDGVFDGRKRMALRVIRESNRGHRAVVRICDINIYKGFGFEERHDLGRVWEGFGTSSCEFSLGRGGQEVRILPMGTDLVGEEVPNGRMCRVCCGDEDGGHIVSLDGKMNQVGGTRFDWGLVSDDGEVVLTCCRETGMTSVFELSGGRCVHSFLCNEAIVEVMMVGQHWLVAIGQSGRTHEWHFDQFCREDSCRSLLHRWKEAFSVSV